MTHRLSSLVLLAALIAPGAMAARPDGQLEVTIVDEATGDPLAARMTLRNPRGKAMQIRGVGTAALGDHFYADGRLLFKLRRGQYTFDLDAGPEYHPRQGSFEIQRRSEDTTQIEMRRAANLAEEGWMGADLDAPREVRGLPVAMRAEQLAMPTRIGWRREDNRWELVDDQQPSEPALVSGAAWEGLRFYRADASIDEQKISEVTSLDAEALVDLRSEGWRIVAADVTDWRLPIWLAYDALDAVVVIDRASLADREPRRATGYPRDTTRYPGVRGAGRWREAIYFQALNAGLVLPPVAGSGSGENDRPLGAARAYAKTFGERTPADWWAAVGAGSTFVTTGPLLRPSVEGHPPGRAFYLGDGESTDFQIALSLTTRDPIEYLEILRNGEVEAAVALRDVAKSGGRLPPLAFDGPGWFAVRAAPVNDRVYHRALSAPFYVTQGGDYRVSKRSCQFFLDWLEKIGDRASEEEIAHARGFWAAQLAKSNAP